MTRRPLLLFHVALEADSEALALGVVGLFAGGLIGAGLVLTGALLIVRGVVPAHAAGHFNATPVALPHHH